MDKQKLINLKQIERTLILFFLASFSTIFFSQTNNDKNTQVLKIGGSLRLRGESKIDYNFNESNQSYGLSQLRINLNWKPASWVNVYVEGQDSRVFGEDINEAPKIDKEATPNIYQDAFDLHQFSVTILHKFGETPVSLKIGRQKYNLGALRLVASLEWVNTARVADGITLSIGAKSKRYVDVFWSRLVPVDPIRFNDHRLTGNRYFDSYFGGAYYTDKELIANAQLEVYWLYRGEKNVDDAIHTIGARLHRTFDKLSYGGEAAYQFGEFGGVDHSAMMAHLEANLKTNILNKSTFGIAYNFGSGDNDPTDAKHGTFDNLYPLNHAYYGYMDLFSLQNIHNLEFTVKTKLFDRLGLRLAWQSFWLVDAENDSWFNAGLGIVRGPTLTEVDSHVANEIDATVKYSFPKIKLTLIGNYSYLMTGKYIEQTGNSVNPSFMFVAVKYTL